MTAVLLPNPAALRLRGWLASAPAPVFALYGGLMAFGGAAGFLIYVSQTLWTMEDIATRIETRTAKPAKRGPYKKRKTA